MKILILGGTVFVGRHLVEAALARGHEVTLFNRGQHNADLFPEVEKLRGDRDGGLGRADRAAPGMPSLTPAATSRALSGSRRSCWPMPSRCYVFISSHLRLRRHQRAAAWTKPTRSRPCRMRTAEEITGETYGPLKVLCEQAVDRAVSGPRPDHPARLHRRPARPDRPLHLLAAPGAQGGDVLAPGQPDTAASSSLMPAIWPSGRSGCWNGAKRASYNATGPDYPLTLGRAAGRPARPSAAATPGSSGLPTSFFRQNDADSLQLCRSTCPDRGLDAARPHGGSTPKPSPPG